MRVMLFFEQQDLQDRIFLKNSPKRLYLYKKVDHRNDFSNRFDSLYVNDF